MSLPTQNNSSMMAIISLFTIVISLLSLYGTEAQIGVCYGNSGDNLPSPQNVVNLYKSNGIKAMRLYYPDQATLQALNGSGISLMLSVPNDNVQAIASSQDQANFWVKTNVVPYGSFIKYIAVGNEIPTSDPRASSILQAMQNILNALYSNSLIGIKVSTSINFNLIKNSYPPSSGEFVNPSFMSPIINFLSNNDSPLLVNIYPYLAYKGDPTNVPLDYALFRWPGIKFTDPSNGLGYQNLFDAMLDSVHAAIGKIGGFSVMNANNWKPGTVASENGWASGGGFGANFDNARTYYTNLANHVSQGTPLTRGQSIETYLFSMFDEDKKQGDTIERNYGLFYPNGQPKYGHINF